MQLNRFGFFCVWYDQLVVKNDNRVQTDKQKKGRRGLKYIAVNI